MELSRRGLILGGLASAAVGCAGIVGAPATGAAGLPELAQADSSKRSGDNNRNTPCEVLRFS